MNNKTERLPAENILKREVKELFDSYPFYHMLLDAEHRILSANKAVGEVLGKNPESIIGEYCPRVIHGLNNPYPGCPLEESLEQNRIVEKEIFDSGTGRWVKSAIYPTRYETEKGLQVFSHIVYDITESKREEEELKNNYKIQNVIMEILHISLMNLSFEEQLQRILQNILSLPWLSIEKKGAIFIVEDFPELLVMKAQNGMALQLLSICRQVPFGRCLCGKAAISRELICADFVDGRHENRFEGMPPHGHYCVPVLYENRTLGVIALYLKAGHSCNIDEEKFLSAVANVVGGIIKRNSAENQLKKSLSNLRKSMEGFIQVLVSIVESRDPYTAGHQRRVADLARSIAREMGLSKDKIDGVRMAGSIHDLGKIAVPAEILSKPSKLNENEFNLIKMHPKTAYDLLKDTEFPWPVAAIVYQHHERINGSGYPIGLTGEKIMIEAKILGVADVVEAIASHRPYRPAVGIDRALEEISSKKGVLYDEEVVDACLNLFKNTGYSLSVQPGSTAP